MAARRGKGDPAACPGSLVHMSNYLVTYQLALARFFLAGRRHVLSREYASHAHQVANAHRMHQTWTRPPFPRRRPQCSTKRGREGTPLAQQDVDAKARRSLNKTFLYKDERRSLNKTLTRRHAARSTRLDDVDLDFPQQHAFPTSNSRTECNPSTRRRRESPHAVFPCCRKGGARRSQVAAVAPDDATACRPFALQQSRSWYSFLNP